VAEISKAKSFVPAHQILSLPGSVEIVDVFKALDRAKAGGLVVTAAGIPTLYAPIRDLANAFLGEVQRKGWPALAHATLAQVVDAAIDAAALNGATFGGSLLGKLDEAAVERPRRTFFAVVDAARVHFGWYLSEEALARTIESQPLAFLCERGHRNEDPEHGRCHSCEAPIVGLAP
jgi:hypothetical protein